MSAAPAAIPLVDLKAQHASIRDEVVRALMQVVDDQLFEDRWDTVWRSAVTRDAHGARIRSFHKLRGVLQAHRHTFCFQAPVKTFENAGVAAGNVAERFFLRAAAPRRVHALYRAPDESGRSLAVVFSKLCAQ